VGVTKKRACLWLPVTAVLLVAWLIARGVGGTGVAGEVYGVAGEVYGAAGDAGEAVQEGPAGGVAEEVYGPSAWAAAGKTGPTVAAAAYDTVAVQTYTVSEAVYRHRIMIVTSQGYTGVLSGAYRGLKDDYGFGLRLYTQDDLKVPDTVARMAYELQATDVVLFEMVGAASKDGLKALHDAALDTCRLLATRSTQFPDLPRLDYSLDGVLRVYFDYGGKENMRRLLLYLASNFTGVTLKPGTDISPLPLPGRFIYHPDAATVAEAAYGSVESVVYGVYADGTFARLADYKAWYRASPHYHEDGFWVGIITYDSYFKNDNCAVPVALLRKLEERGANVILVFSDSKRDRAVRDFFMEGGRAAIDVLVSMVGFNFVYGKPEEGVKLFRELNVPVITPTYSGNLDRWEADPAGIAGEIHWQVAMPELDGSIEPLFTGGYRVLSEDELTGARLEKIVPLEDRIARLAGRALAWAGLRHKPPAEKKVAVIYYNHDAGRDNIGASYLNVMASAAEVLNALSGDGYWVPGGWTQEKVQELILRQGRNVGGWAPGELADLVAAGALTLPVDRYVYWYQELPEKLRAELEEAWGPPPGKIMVFGDSFVFPGALLGNVFLGPQPMRGWAEDPEKIKHDPRLPPTHQYLAFYLWLQKEFKADAVVHLGTHGTLEWLPGRSVGLGSDDWPDVLLGDMPDVYPYIVNNPGEGTQAKRRGYAVTIDHLTPPMIKPQLYGDLAELFRLAGEARDVLQREDQARAAALREEILKKIDALHLAPELDFDPRAADLRTLAENLEEYLEGLTRELMPYGLHTFGQPPPGELLDLFAQAIVDYDPGTREAIYEEIRQRLLRTTDEMTNLLRALRGEYVPPGLGRDPVRVPDALPTGRNLVSFDPRMVPNRVAWRVGAQVADKLVEDYYKAHGTYPEAVGVVLWAIETMRTGGETVALILRLIGTEPVWDSAGRVSQVKVTPLAELGRPRIDVVVTISGLFRDTFSHVVGVLDQAFRLVAGLDETGNFVRQHYLSLLNELQQAGVPAEQAAALAGARIFGEPPGTYGMGVAELVKATTAWDDTRDLVETYMNRMSYVYGRDTFGQPAWEAFGALLRRVEAVVQVRDSLYGVLDNDDVFQYLGGLKLAAEAASGRTVDAYIANTRDAHAPQVQTLQQFLGAELRTRLFNPQWIEGMLKEGFSGARTISDHVANLFGLDATTRAVDDWVWRQVAESFVFNEAIRSRLNPWALQSIIGWNLEAARRGMWQADAATLQRLADAYVQTAAQYGVVCCHHTCANLVFNEWVASYSALPSETLNRFRERLAEATAKTITLPVRGTPGGGSAARPAVPPPPVSPPQEQPQSVITAPEQPQSVTPAPEQPLTAAVVSGPGAPAPSPAAPAPPGQAFAGPAGAPGAGPQPAASVAGAGEASPAPAQAEGPRAYEIEIPRRTDQSGAARTAVTALAVAAALGLVALFARGLLRR